MPSVPLLPVSCSSCAVPLSPPPRIPLPVRSRVLSVSLFSVSTYCAYPNVLERTL